MKHEKAIKLITGELCKIGGELFSIEFYEAVLKEQAKLDIGEAKKELNVYEFMTTLLDVDPRNEKEKLFHSLLQSLLYLGRDT